MPLMDASAAPEPKRAGSSLPEFIQAAVPKAGAARLVPLPAIVPPEPEGGTPSKTVYGMNGPIFQAGTNASVPEEKQTAYERALQARAIGADVQGPHLPGHGVGTGDVERMTQEKYDALDPQQRAAVDFNTMLVQATRKDLKHQDDYESATDQQRATYDAALEKMFGDTARDSETYAPETVALLRQIGYSDDTSDLDDFLNLNAAITAKDLKGVGPKDDNPISFLDPMAMLGTDPASTDPAQVRADAAQSLSYNTQLLEQKLAEGSQLLQSITATAAVDRNDMVSNEMIGMGGIANTPHARLGYGPSNLTPDGEPADLNTFFQQAYTQLTQKKGGLTLDEVQSKMDALPDQGAFEAFMDYANTRSGNAARFGQSLGDAPGVKYRTPEQFRQLLGLDE